MAKRYLEFEFCSECEVKVKKIGRIFVLSVKENYMNMKKIIIVL